MGMIAGTAARFPRSLEYGERQHMLVIEVYADRVFATMLANTYRLARYR